MRTLFKLHDILKEKGIEEIQLGSLPEGESLGEKFVDEFMSVEESTKINKKIGRLKRKIIER
jgi:hypothetical protein